MATKGAKKSAAKKVTVSKAASKATPRESTSADSGGDGGREPFFDPIQHRIVSYALTLLAGVVFAGLIVYLFVLFIDFVSFFSFVLWPISVALVLALLLRPLVGAIERRISGSRAGAVAILYSLILFASAALVFIVVPVVFAQILDLLAFVANFRPSSIDIPGWVPENIRGSIEEYLSREDVQLSISENVTKLRDYLVQSSVPALGATGDWLLSFFAQLSASAVIPIYLFYLLLTDHNPIDSFDEHLSFLSDEVKDDILFLMNEFMDILTSFFRGQILIGMILGVLLAIGFSLIGLKGGFVIGLTLGLLNIVPYLGLIIGLAIVVPLSFFQDGGGIWMVAQCLVCFTAVQLFEGYFLTPKIMGKQTGLHPMAVIFSIFFWGTAINGLLGMILAIPLSAFFITAWRLVRKKYLSRLLGHPDQPLREGA